jgi:hypothetical protein
VYLREQTGRITLRKMFAEYTVKIGEKAVGLLCDYQLFVRIMPPTSAILGEDAIRGEERDLLIDVFRAVRTALPAPKIRSDK